MDTTQLYQLIVEQASEAVIFADTAGMIQLWNGGAVALFGYSTSEALGQSLDLIIPERLRKAHWAGFDRALKVGHTQHGREVLTTRSVHKNGPLIYVNLAFSVIRDGAGNVIGALATGADFTARYLEEKAIRKRVADLESRIKAEN